MNAIATQQTRGGSSTSGGRWVERYLLPLLQRRGFATRPAPIECLQIEPDDETEAARLRAEGFLCDVILFDARRLSEPWAQAPIIREDLRNLGVDRKYDLITMGLFGKATINPQKRLQAACELARVCKKGGAFLTTIGNRLCPVDVSRNAPLLHGLSCRAAVTPAEMKEIFVEGAGFSALEPLSVYGHFEMSRVHPGMRWIARLLMSYWRRIATPERRWIYASPLNPVLMFWIER